MTVACVYLPVPFGDGFSYLVPEGLSVKPGQWVEVPFGNRKLKGIIASLEGKEVPGMRFLEKVYEVPAACPSFLTFISWVANYTLTPLGAVLRMSLPDKIGNISSWAGSLKREPEAFLLSLEQKKAAQNMEKMLGQFKVALLDGVTGSGKTEVYFEVLSRVLSQGGQALILLPEISLSAQWIERYERRFGQEVAVWHSQITPAQKRKIWHGLLSGDVKVLVGARSSLFLPFKKLDLIIVDEEHDASYKQEDGVIYNGRDMAVVRGKVEQCPVILVSATPSLESWDNVRQGRYIHIPLFTRFNRNQLPHVKLLDLRKWAVKDSWVSPPLRQALREGLESGEQSLLFLNRRGFAPLTLCASCGYRFSCPDCAAWLVKHKGSKGLLCHHCGYEHILPKICPACGEEESFLACGPGVERIADEVLSFLPKARLLTLSSDQLSLKKMEQAVDQIERREVDIIIGTQVVAKGHDFKNLSCVGVIDGDLGLVGGDFRGAERTFQLLTQVAGRAGRHHTLGRVFLQTHEPENPLMKALSLMDRDQFFAMELEQRESFGWPPFGRLVSLILTSSDEVFVEKWARWLVSLAPDEPQLRILGPAPAPLYKIRNKYRWRLLLKASKTLDLQGYIKGWIGGIKIPSRVRCQIDIDPQSFF